jgi:phage terminase large subunit-like protein
MFTDAVTLKKCRCDLTLADFRGCEAFAGLDLSSGGDLTTLALEFERGGVDYAWSLSFMPRGRLEEHKVSDVAPYDQWERDGLILVTGGRSDYKNDYGFIVAELKRLIADYGIRLSGIGYDPHNADGFLASLEELGAPLLEIRQSARFLNDGTDDIQNMMKSGRYQFDRKNELLDWSFRNARIVKNSFGEKKVDKDPKARNRRIDPVDAAIDAHIARMKLAGKAIDYNAAMSSYLEKMGWSGKGKT